MKNSKKTQNTRIYQIKVLDMKFQKESNLLSFSYIRYRVKAKHQELALEKARELYMRGEKGIFNEELPILLKLFCTESIR